LKMKKGRDDGSQNVEIESFISKAQVYQPHCALLVVGVRDALYSVLCAPLMARGDTPNHALWASSPGSLSTHSHGLHMYHHSNDRKTCSFMSPTLTRGRPPNHKHDHLARTMTYSCPNVHQPSAPRQAFRDHGFEQALNPTTLKESLDHCTIGE
jgi:hypothetical protein